MTQDALLYIMAGAVGVSALALLLQVFLLLGMYKAIRQVQERIADFAPKAESLLTLAEDTIQENRKHVQEVLTKANAVVDSAKNQMGKVDEFLSEATGRAKAQMDRLELVLDDTVSRLHETVVVLNSGILKPIREINGVTAGIRTAISHLFRGGRPTVAQATHDEEMFI